MGNGNRTAPFLPCRGNAGGDFIAIDKRTCCPEKAIGIDAHCTASAISPLSIDRTHLDISRGIQSHSAATFPRTGQTPSHDGSRFAGNGNRTAIPFQTAGLDIGSTDITRCRQRGVSPDFHPHIQKFVEGNLRRGNREVFPHEQGGICREIPSRIRRQTRQSERIAHRCPIAEDDIASFGIEGEDFKTIDGVIKREGFFNLDRRILE